MRKIVLGDPEGDILLDTGAMTVLFDTGAMTDDYVNLSTVMWLATAG